MTDVMKLLSHEMLTFLRLYAFVCINSCVSLVRTCVRLRTLCVTIIWRC